MLVRRYEDLIEHTEATLRAICAFAGIPFDPAMLGYHEVERHWFGQGAPKKGSGTAGSEHLALRNWQINQPIFDGRGAWRQVLAPADLLPLQSGPGRTLMAAFGYDVGNGAGPVAAD